MISVGCDGCSGWAGAGIVERMPVDSRMRAALRSGQVDMESRQQREPQDGGNRPNRNHEPDTASERHEVTSICQSSCKVKAARACSTNHEMTTT